MYWCGNVTVYQWVCLNQPPPQRNDWYRGPTELVQLSAYRGSSHRRKGAARNIIDMVWLYRSPILVGRKGVFYLFNWFLTAFAVPRGRGRGSQHPVVGTTFNGIVKLHPITICHARVCLLMSPMIFEGCLDSNPKYCRSKHPEYIEEQCTESFLQHFSVELNLQRQWTITEVVLK